MAKEQRPANYQKRYDENRKFDSHTVLSFVIIPGVLGIIGAIIVARIIPGLMQAIISQDSFERMGNRISSMLDNDFSLLFSADFLRSPIIFLLLFGFILGIFIRYGFGADRVK